MTFHDSVLIITRDDCTILRGKVGLIDDHGDGRYTLTIEGPRFEDYNFMAIADGYQQPDDDDE